MKYPNSDSIVWQFDTPNFRVVCHIEQSDCDPADSFEFPEDIAAVRDERVLWFDAFVSVWFGDDEDSLTYLAHDCLCGCAYTTTEEFVASHRDRDPMNRNCSIMREAHGQNVVICHYFPDMVSQAIHEARNAIPQIITAHESKATRLRTAHVHP